MRAWIDGTSANASKTGEKNHGTLKSNSNTRDENSDDVSVSNMRYDAYMSLLDHRIRNAYVSCPSRLEILPLISDSFIHFFCVQQTSQPASGLSMWNQ